MHVCVKIKETLQSLIYKTGGGKQQHKHWRCRVDCEVNSPEVELSSKKNTKAWYRSTLVMTQTMMVDLEAITFVAS